MVTTFCIYKNITMSLMLVLQFFLQNCYYVREYKYKYNVNASMSYVNSMSVHSKHDIME